MRIRKKRGMLWTLKEGRDAYDDFIASIDMDND
jgi:hypothetical protein